MKLLLLVAATVVLIPTPAPAREYPAEIVRVIDGDTFVANIDLGLGIEARLRHVRLLGVDAPERGSAGGEESRTFARETLAGKKVRLVTAEKELDAFGRVLAAVKIEREDFGERLRAKGLGK